MRAKGNGETVSCRPSLCGACRRPCSHDFHLAATRCFDALTDGEIPLAVLFCGTIFQEPDEGRLQVARIPWQKEATFRLPAITGAIR
jgi:hypothetical protein